MLAGCSEQCLARLRVHEVHRTWLPQLLACVFGQSTAILRDHQPQSLPVGTRRRSSSAIEAAQLVFQHLPRIVGVRQIRVQLSSTVISARRSRTVLPQIFPSTYATSDDQTTP